MTAILALLLLSPPPANAAPATDASYASAVRIRDRIRQVLKDTEPLLEELRGMRTRYETGLDFEKTDFDRMALRRRLDAQQDVLFALRKELNDLRREHMVGQLSGLLGRRGMKSLGDTAAQSLDFEEFYQEAHDFKIRLRQALAEDDGAYEAAQFARRRLKKRRIFAWAAGLLAMSGTAAFLLTARRVRKAAAPPPAPLEGKYRIEKELGRGGMGIVYEAADLELQRRVAIKFMSPEIGRRPEELDRFLAEARMVAALEHPNIVKILTILREASGLYLVFEFVPGKPLSGYLCEGRPLPLAFIKPVLRQAAAALDYAHSKRIIHRDFKPANVMITPQGQVKVMDFGIAHQARLTAAKLTRAEAWGTPPYMAPEQELGTVARESDIYALGVCLYEMLTGSLPFAGPNFLAQKREMIFRPPSESAPLPKSADAVLSRALAAEPSRRFHSAKELYDEFERALPGQAA